MCCQNQLLRIWIPFLFLIALRFPFFVPNNSGMFNFNLGFRSGNCSCGTHSHLHLNLHLYSAIWNECFGVVLCVSKCIMLIAFAANENVESNTENRNLWNSYEQMPATWTHFTFYIFWEWNLICIFGLFHILSFSSSFSLSSTDIRSC